MKQFDINMDSIIISSPVVIFLCRSTQNWPLELVTENIQQFGYRVEDFISGRIQYLDIIHPHDLEKVNSEISECLKDGCSELTQEYRILTASGETCWVEVKLYIRKDDNGRVTHYQGILFDITQRKTAEESMQKTLEKRMNWKIS